MRSGEVRVSDLGLSDWDLARINRLVFVACGSSFHAALVGKYLVESIARVPVEVDIASEFRYRKPVLDGRVLTVTISQSGETADTLAAARHARMRGSRVVAICNVVGSSLAREADGVFYTRAGIEIGVASTKAFTAQLVAVMLLAIKLARARKLLEPDQARCLIQELQTAPSLLRDTLALSDSISALADGLLQQSGYLYLGRGVHYPIALEGALKLKEITYTFAEGYAAGEMKHGPIALIERGMPVIAIAPAGPTYDKMASNIEEVKAREATVIAVATEGDEAIAAQADHTIFIPKASATIQPLLTVVPLQLLAYHVAVKRGCDVDQPRNLAKSVTVE
jgi:glucosamine--fructose-6-phosphate aminotransferase (isomerizing)